MRAERARHKLTDISGGTSQAVVLDAPLDLEEVRAGLEAAHFTGKGDESIVMWLTHEFDWQIMVELRAVVRAERLGTRLEQARLSRLSISGGERPSTALVVPAPAAGPSVRAWGLGAWGVRLPRRRRASRLLVGVGGRRSLPPEHGAEHAIDEL